MKVQQLLFDLQTNFVNDITTIHPLVTVFTRCYFSRVCCQAMHDVLCILYRTPLLANVFYWLFISIVRTKSVGLQSACNRKEEEEVRRVGRVLQKVTSFNKLTASEMKLHLRKFLFNVHKCGIIGYVVGTNHGKQVIIGCRYRLKNICIVPRPT